VGFTGLKQTLVSKEEKKFEEREASKSDVKEARSTGEEAGGVKKKNKKT